MADIEKESGGFEGLFENLRHVIAVSRQKFDLERASNSDKQKWARLLIQGCEAYGKLMETAKIEEIEARVSELEAAKPQVLEPLSFPRENLFERLKREEDERKNGGIRYD